MITLTVLRWNTRCDFLRAAWQTTQLYLPTALAFGAVYLSGPPSHATLWAAS